MPRDAANVAVQVPEGGWRLLPKRVAAFRFHQLQFGTRGIALLGGLTSHAIACRIHHAARQYRHAVDPTLHVRITETPAFVVYRRRISRRPSRVELASAIAALDRLSRRRRLTHCESKDLERLILAERTLLQKSGGPE